MQYRSEIDGLRALAVLPVILFHAGFELFSGGYVGVDIFFVISGYLITSIIIEDIEKNRFSLIHFYERRARRILPALFLVLLACLPFAWIWMIPGQLENFSESLVSVGLFSSNILFWLQTGYFDVAAEEKPLLHTWSLAVEEQYYLVFPILMILTWRFGKNRVFWMIAVFAALSLALSEWSWRQDDSTASANFFLAPTRAWELLAGSIAAFLVRKRGVQANNFLSLLGLAAIFVAIFAYDQTTPFPSAYALVPVLGVFLLILYSGQGTWTEKLLSTRILVAIGLISYSAYLWHQPLFAFARIRMHATPEPALMLALAVISLLLAAMSWKWVEQPFRKRFSRRTIFTVSAAGLAFFIGVGLIGNYLKGAANPYFSVPKNIQWESLEDKVKNIGDICEQEPILADPQSWLTGCKIGVENGGKRVVLLGDSHSQAIGYALDRALKDRNIEGQWLQIDGCEPIPFFRSNRNRAVGDCDKRFDRLLSYIESLNADVIVLNRWTYRLYPITGLDLDMPYRNSEGFDEAGNFREFDVLKNGNYYRDPASKSEAVERYIAQLSEASSRLFLVYPIPETGIDIFRLNWDHWNRKGTVLQDISTPYADYENRNAFVTGIFDRLSQPNIVPVRTDLLFCNQEFPDRCTMQYGGVPLYVDDDHLGARGADRLVDQIASLANWGQPVRPQE